MFMCAIVLASIHGMLGITVGIILSLSHKPKPSNIVLWNLCKFSAVSFAQQ